MEISKQTRTGMIQNYIPTFIHRSSKPSKLKLEHALPNKRFLFVSVDVGQSFVQNSSHSGFT